MKKVYIATKLENYEIHNRVRDELAKSAIGLQRQKEEHHTRVGRLALQLAAALKE